MVYFRLKGSKKAKKENRVENIIIAVFWHTHHLGTYYPRGLLGLRNKASLYLEGQHGRRWPLEKAGPLGKWCASRVFPAVMRNLGRSSSTVFSSPIRPLIRLNVVITSAPGSAVGKNRTPGISSSFLWTKNMNATHYVSFILEISVSREWWILNKYIRKVWKLNYIYPNHPTKVEGAKEPIA